VVAREELINQRLGWLLTAQGVIGAGCAWLMQWIAEIATEIAVGVYAAVFDRRSPRDHYRHHAFQVGISAGTTIAGLSVAVSMPLVCRLAWKIVDEKLRGAL
jgi:hypothetical protein